jgi:hypothetical protein
MIPNIFTVEELEFLRTLPEVLQAEAQLAKASNIYFQVDLPESYHQILKDRLNVDITSPVPFRWIRGDTPSHVDRGAGPFEKTHLVYLTDAEGVIEIGEETYPITAGTGFVFEEGIHHQVTQTNGSSRLLLGPMSELGMAVGVPGITADGETDTVYIRSAGVSGAEYRINDGEWFTAFFPLAIVNTNIDPTTNILKIYFTTDLTLTGADAFFVCTSEGIQFGDKNLNESGNRPLISIADTLDYPGFIQNGNEFAAGFNHVYVYNLAVLSVNSVLLPNGGWLGQKEYGRGATNNVIVSCIVQGDVSAGGGGIVGANAGRSQETAAELRVAGCIHLGAIGLSAGGIVGSYCGNLNISQCAALGIVIDEVGGGIVGAFAGAGANCAIVRCYSVGDVNSDAGGIVGTNAADTGLVGVAYCYALGAIASSGGGIIGSLAGSNDGSVTAFGCYTTGVVTDGGGIFGADPGTISPQSCYTSGTVTGMTGYIVAGSATVLPDSYSEAANGSSGWNTANAAAVLGGPLTGFTDNWVSTGVDQPYELNNFGVSPYTVLVTSDGTDLVTTYTQNIPVGGSTSSAISTGGPAYSIVGSPDPTITINADTGVIQTTASTPGGTYTFVVRSINFILYTNTVVTLTVEGGSKPSAGGIVVPAPTGKGFDFELLTSINMGKRFVDERLTNPNIRFNSYRDYLRYRTAIANYAPK